MIINHRVRRERRSLKRHHRVLGRRDDRPYRVHVGEEADRREMASLFEGLAYRLPIERVRITMSLFRGVAGLVKAAKAGAPAEA